MTPRHWLVAYIVDTLAGLANAALTAAPALLERAFPSAPAHAFTPDEVLWDAELAAHIAEARAESERLWRTNGGVL